MLSWEGRKEWSEAGAKKLRTRARDRVFDVWQTHEVPPLPDEVLQGMRRIVESRLATLG